jgi:hypothetical protein
LAAVIPAPDQAGGKLQPESIANVDAFPEPNFNVGGVSRLSPG